MTAVTVHRFWASIACAVGFAAGIAVHAQTPADVQPVRKVMTFNGVEREYFIRAPARLDPQRTYWLVAAAHGAGGNGRTFFLASGLRRYADEIGLDAIIVSPTFSAADGAAQQFPSLGEGAFLDAIVVEVRREYTVYPRFLMAGYSRGGQFAHRYCQNHPDRVAACAPMAAGTWTTPDGSLLVQGSGELASPEAAQEKAAESLVAEALSPRIAPVAWKRAAPGAQTVPFLVMTGTLDPRYAVGQLFADKLKSAGFRVEVSWPVTNHTSNEATRTEFERYAREAAAFFAKVAGRR